MATRHVQLFGFVLAVCTFCLFLLGAWNYERERLSRPPYLVLRNYNPEAGLGWMLHNVMMASHEARCRGMSLIVLFDSGLYLETNAVFQKQYHVDATNWFNYYFKPIGPQQLAVPKNLTLLPSENQDSLLLDHDFYEFERTCFKRPASFGTYLFSQEWRFCFQLLPFMKQQIDSFFNTWLKAYPSIAVHYRGTDKYASLQGHEDNPRKIPYEWVSNRIRRFLTCLSYSTLLFKSKDYKKHTKNNTGFSHIRILACSDEQPFVDHIRKSFSRPGDPQVVATLALRSSTCTSGLELDCHNQKDHEKLSKMPQTSIHRGMPHASAYLKGENAIVEIFLMSMCNLAFFRSRGNMSNMVRYANPSLQVFDMVGEYTKESITTTKQLKKIQN